MNFRAILRISRQMVDTNAKGMLFTQNV